MMKLRKKSLFRSIAIVFILILLIVLLQNKIYKNLVVKNKSEPYFDYGPVKKEPSRTIILCENELENSNVNDNNGEYNHSIGIENEKFRISCPNNKKIKIFEAYFGRKNNDKNNCKLDKNGKTVDRKYLLVEEEEQCRNDITSDIVDMCDGKKECILIPNSSIYGDPCPLREKYLSIKYKCRLEIPDPKIAVVMFTDAENTKEDSIYSYSIQTFRNYSMSNNYEFIIETEVYDKERKIYYMKLYTLIEHMIKALKEKTIEWMFWVDGDTILLNRNLKLGTFLPPPEKEDINFIISNDHNGMNAGVFFIKVNQWSLSFLLRACAYQYFTKKKSLRFHDQTSIEDVLVEHKEDKHFIIVPQNWFNIYCCVHREGVSDVKKGDFLMHLAGKKQKEKLYKEYTEKVENDNEWLSKDNEQMREEVLRYYYLDKSKQIKVREKPKGRIY